MRHYIFRIIIEFIIIFNCVNSENIFKKNDKSPPGGLQMCIESFDVHKDKIIRTQDSLALGAKYIMEVEVDDRQNCLRLCCQTNDCDVFIFEDKKRGSCYLFHCGPPHDFKCKFTSHANYTSAVLTNLSYRNSLYMEQTSKSQQEHELKSLRKMSTLQVPAQYIYTDPPVIITKTPKPIVPTTLPPVKTGCSRNQYECRTSGDCIAIYNVCDGIPQCTDGSDEATELGCPTEKPTPPPPVIPPMILPRPELVNYPDSPQHRKNLQLFYEESKAGPKPWQLPMGHQMLPQQHGPPYPPQGAASTRENYGGQGYIGGWEYRQMYEQNKDNYPINSIRGKGDIPHYDREQQPHIFNHKQPGMVPENVERVGYVESERPYESYYQAQNHPGWQQIPPQMVPIQPKLQIVPTSPPVIKKLELHSMAQEQVKLTPVPSLTVPLLPKMEIPMKLNPSIKKELKTQKIIDPPLPKVEPKVFVEKQQTVKEDGKAMEEEIPHSEQEEHHTEEARVHHFAEHLKQSNHKDSEEVLRPRGAVISLALGLTVTAISAALIGCRLRVVRKRGRRGNGPYTHDADYLVNGMYL